MAAKKPILPKKAAVAKKSRARTPPFKEHPDWSEAKFWSFLRSGLRGTYNRWPPKWTILAEAKRAYQGDDKRTKWEYQCAQCQNYYKQKEISVDHIHPAGSLNNFNDIAGFVERLFVGTQGLQVLCKECHDRKTREDKVK